MRQSIYYIDNIPSTRTTLPNGNLLHSYDTPIDHFLEATKVFEDGVDDWWTWEYHPTRVPIVATEYLPAERAWAPQLPVQNRIAVYTDMNTRIELPGDEKYRRYIPVWSVPKEDRPHDPRDEVNETQVDDADERQPENSRHGHGTTSVANSNGQQPENQGDGNEEDQDEDDGGIRGSVVSDADPTHQPPFVTATTRAPLDRVERYVGVLTKLWQKEGREESHDVQLPDGYSLWRILRKDGSRVDEYLFGHPGHHPFRSPQEFYPHYKHLVDGSADCECQYCNKPSKKL